MPLNNRHKNDWVFWFAVLLALLCGMVIIGQWLFLPA
jgi:hypothetical protein